MDPVNFYQRFTVEFFYSFHKHSSDIELEELGKRYNTCLEKNRATISGILDGSKHPDDLRSETRQELESLADAEATFSNDVPVNIKAAHFDSETGFRRLHGELRRLVEGRTHLVRLIKPSEYGDDPPQNIFCQEFGLDLLEYLKGVRSTNKAKLTNLRKAIACRKNGIYQFWALAPYVHHRLMEIGCAWDISMMTLLKIAGRRYAKTRQPFAGRTKHQLGYDERMPTHLIARIEAMRDIACLTNGHYAEQYGINMPER